ncbi:TPA: hypothetical protein N0F65_006313 [Lagenidium giganteum]|uniref:Small ribosomal subunit protein eS1 n=1 Tax=Lagenidium giganteum TaxID=4803 RepID=A0AAV2YQ10_9STRA|nr:TPA: hypothetical protein N0F65_006313 [Lagenidium giganteum]
MANKRISKGKKGGKKKVVDPFTRKDWYDVKAPAIFSERNCGKTLVNRTTGTKIASEALKGRVFEVCLADLNKDEDQSFRKIRLCAEEVQGNQIVTGFHGMDFTRDKLCSLIRKWQTLIEAFVDVKTTDGYVVRLFCIAFTKKRPNQIKKTCYAQHAQVRAIRKKMTQIMTEHASKVDIKDLFLKFIPEIIGKEIEKATQGIYPLQNVYIRKCKIMKKPKFDLVRLMELHEGGAEEKGAKVARPEDQLVESLRCEHTKVLFGDLLEGMELGKPPTARDVFGGEAPVQQSACIGLAKPAATNMDDKRRALERKFSENRPPLAYAKLSGRIFDDTPFEALLTHLPAELGRGPVSNVPGPRIALGEQKAISRQHARIQWNQEKGSFELVCLGKNGMFAAGKFVPKDQTVDLVSKMPIKIGHARIYFLAAVRSVCSAMSGFRLIQRAFDKVKNTQRATDGMTSNEVIQVVLECFPKSDAELGGKDNLTSFVTNYLDVDTQNFEKVPASNPPRYKIKPNATPPFAVSTTASSTSAASSAAVAAVTPATNAAKTSASSDLNDATRKKQKVEA